MRALTTVSLKMEQKLWAMENGISISKLLQDVIDERMKQQGKGLP
jgi:hypothetical protein